MASCFYLTMIFVLKKRDIIYATVCVECFLGAILWYLQPCLTLSNGLTFQILQCSAGTNSVKVNHGLLT